MPRSTARSAEPLSGDRLDSVVAQVRRERGVSLRALDLEKLSRAGEAELLAALGRAGLEHTGTTLRVPLREQVREQVARAGEHGISESALVGELKGARNAAEVRLIVRELVGAGQLALRAVGGTARLTLHGPHLLAEAELEQLAQIAAQLAALAKATRPVSAKPRPSLARSELEAPLAALRELTDRGRRDRRVESALCAAFLVSPASAGFVRVPDVIRALERAHPRPALLAATDALARAGVLELRPEAAIGRLAEDERARCLLALDGTPLSYARLINPDEGARA